MSILLCVPTYETITTECYKALWELESPDPLMFDTVKGYDCALARISACNKARKYGVDYLLMVDSDTVLPPDALSNMLEHDEDIVLGYYQWKKRKKGHTCIARLGTWGDWHQASDFKAMANAGMTSVEVQGGGLGCCLLRVSVLDRLPKPWFRWVVTADGTETGEDVYFCNLLRDHGVPIYADTRVACGHAYREVHEL